MERIYNDHAIPVAELPEPTPDPLLQPLLQLLAAGTIDIPTLCDKLATTPAILAELMDSEDLQEHLRLKMQLAQVSLKLRTIELLPQATAALETSLTSGKPEVARRAAVALYHVNGISTTPPKFNPYIKPELAKPETPQDPQEEDPVGVRVYAGLDLLFHAFRRYFEHDVKTNLLPDDYVINVLTKLQASPGALPIKRPG